MPIPGYVFSEFTSCADPLLSNVDCTVILTLSGSKRLVSEKAAELMRLSKRTFVLVNQGIRSHMKPNWVTDTAYDITHAYVSACAFCELFRFFGHVLFLEDDAELFYLADENDFESIDSFLATELFDCYSMASMGWTVHKDAHHRWLFPSALGIAHCHAVVWSHSLRLQLLSETWSEIHHIDGDFLSKCPRMFMYHVPVIVQTLPATQNQRAWTMLSGSRRHSDLKRAISNAWMRAWIRCIGFLHLDFSPYHWSTIFWVQSAVPIVVAVCVFLCFVRYMTSATTAKCGRVVH